MKLIAKFESLDSTITYAVDKLDLSKTEEFGIVWTLYQTAGNGQKGNTWESEPAKNLLFSIVLFPNFLEPSNQFILTQVLSLGVLDYLQYRLPKANIQIKWPNDVYANGKKICGMLVHNKIVGTKIYASIAGIGININQEHFSKEAGNPISLANFTQKEYILEEELELISSYIEKRYNKLKEKASYSYHQEYLDNLLNYNQEASYTYNNEVITATIQNVNEYGHLELLINTGEQICCDMKEIKFNI